MPARSSGNKFVDRLDVPNDSLQPSTLVCARDRSLQWFRQVVHRKVR